MGIIQPQISSPLIPIFIFFFFKKMLSFLSFLYIFFYLFLSFLLTPVSKKAVDIRAPRLPSRTFC